MSNAKSSIPPLLESLLQDLHNDFFSDTKTFLRKLETLLLDIPLHSSPEILSKITSLLLLDKKTSLFKYLTSKLGDKERISSSFRKGLLEVIKKYLKAYEKGFSSQVLGIVKTSCLHLFQTDLTAAVKEGALSPIILLVKRFPKVPMKALLQPEKLMEIILKNLRDMKHSAGVKAKLWHLAGLLCSQYSREVDHYRLEVSEVCFNELMSQVESKSKPEIIVIEGLLKGLLQLLYENYLTAGQIQRLWNVLQVLMTPIADVHNYKVINMSLKLVGAHCGLFTAQILKDAIKILDLTLSLFKLTNRTVRERAGECLESLIRILVSLLSPTEEPHKLLFKEILEKVLRLLDQTDVVLLSSGIRVLGHFSRSVRLFRSEGKVRELFTQMLEFSHEKLIKPLENMTPSPDQEEGPLTSQADSFKTILFLQKQVFCFILAFSSVIENLSSLLEKEAIGLFQLSLLAIKAHKQYLQSYKPQLYESLVTLFLSLYVHHHIVFIPWCRKLFSQGLFESLKIPENVILAGEDYHSSLKSACDIWQGLFANGSCWTEASRGLFLSCFFQEVDAQLRALDLSYVISKEEGVEAVYSPNNQDHQQYIYRIVLFLDEILRMREIRETGVLNVWVPNLVRTAIEKLRKFSRITAFYKLLRVSNEVIEELHLFERSESINNPEIIEFKTLLLAFYQEASHNIKLFQEDLLIDALKALIAIPSNLILSSPLLQKLSLIHLKQAFLIKSPLILSLLSLALESLERILSRSLSLKDPFFQDLAPEILPYMASGLYFEAQNLKSLDKKLLFTLTYREIQIEVSAFQDRILDFLGKISGLAHYLIGDPKKNDLEEDSLLLWDTESTISFPLPLTSKKVELNMQQFLPRVLYLLKEGPSLQIQTIAGEFLHGLLIYMIGKSSQGQGKTRGPQQKKKSFAVIYSKILPSLFQIAANPGHPCGKLLGALGLQAVRWLANTRESESPDLVVLINVLMDGLASKEDSSLRDFSYKALLELLIWTVKQRTHAELEQDPGIFRTLLKRIASFSTNPDCLKRHAALLALKAFVLSYKEDSFLGKKFGMESFRICLRLAGSTDETNALSDSKEQLLFLIERHETLLLKSNAFKGQELLLQEIKEGCFRQEPLLREVSLKLFESLLKTGLLKLEETLWNSLCKSIISPLSFLKEGFSNKTLELFTGQMDFWLLIAQKISFRVLELKEFIRSCHNIKSFIEAFAGGNSSMNEKNVLQGVFTSGKEFRGSLKVYQAFKELLIFFNGVEIGLLKALFKAAFQKDALFDCFLQALYKSNPGLFPQSELLFEDIIKEIGKLTKKMEETGLIQEENKSDFVKKALEALSFKNSSELASAVFKGQIGAKKSRFWLDSFGIFLTETNKRAFLRDILSFLSSELDGNSVFTETESSGLQALLEFLSISDYEEIRAFFLEAFLRQNTVFQRFEGIFLGFFAREMQGFEKALELIRETPELLRFLVPILILGALDKRLGFCEKTLEMMNSGEFMKEIGGLFLDKERGLLILKTMVFIFSSQEKNLGLLLKKAGSFIPELISEGLKYPQNPITVIEQAFVLLAYVIKSNDPDFKRDFFEDKLSALLAGILSLSRELNPLMEEEIQEIGGLTKENHPYEQNKGHSSIILSLGTSFLSFLKLTRQFPFIRKYLYHLLRVPELKKPCRETLHSLLTLDFPTLTQLEQNTFLEDLLCDLLDSTGNKEAICPFICETIRFLFNSPEFPQGLILEFTEKAARPLLKVLGEVNGNLTKKALFLGIFETVYENLGLERIREDLHKRLYGIESSRNELTKNLIEICNQAKKTRYEIPFIPFTQAAYNCLISILKKTQTKESIFNQLLFSVSRDKKEELWVNLIDLQAKPPFFEVLTAFKEVEGDNKAFFIKQRRKARNQGLNQAKLTEKLLNQSLFSQTQEVLESNFLPEILKEQVEVPLELQDGFIKEETGEKGLLELDLINCHPNMRNLISLVDFMGEKFPSAPGNAQMPGWMQSLFIEASRKELEPAIFCFLIKILLNRPMLFKPFRRFWYPLLVELIAEKRAPGKGFHYFLRDVSLILIDWHQEVLITDLWVSIGNKEKETVSKAVNNLMKVLADESKDIFRKNLELFEGLLEKWAHLAYLEKGAVISMLSINEEEKDKNKASLLDEKRDNKNKGPPLYLFKYLGASLIELGLCFKVPLLKDFPEFLSVGGIGGNLGPNAFKTYAEPIILSHLLKGLIHKKKLIALASISACGRLFKEIYIHETSEGFIKKTDALNKSMIEVLSGDKLRFVMLLKELVGLFPDFLRNREIFGKALEIITTAGKKDRSHIFKAFRLYIQTHNDRNLIEGDLREICLCIRASIPRILIDSEPECHNECLKLLELLATLLHLPIIRDFFENIFSSISLRYLKSQGFVEAFLELCFRLLDSVKGLMPLQEVVGVNGLEIGLAKLQGQIKRSLLTGLSLDSSSLRSRVFTYFEKDLSISQAPTQRLLSLISDLYDPELEGLWLTSSMPLLLSLAKESSDYERLLFDEPLSETLKFYDFDFRGGDYLLQANRTQPLTPIFTLTLSQAPIHRQEVSLSNNYQPGVRATNINYTQQESFKDISSASQLFLQRKNPLQMPLTLESAQGVLFQKPGSNIPFTQIGGFLKPESRHFKGQKMAAFLSENMVEFSQGGTLNNRLRFQGEKKQGIRINRVEGIRQKQAQLLETRQKEARKHEITALRKYRMGELPDIEIKARDIIDPMQGLCLNDPEIASDLFWLLFTGLFKEEASDDIRTRLLKGLEGFLRKSKAFNKMLMSSVHKIIYVLGKRRVFFMPEFDADLIRETGLKGESLYTSALLLEEQLIHSAEGEESLISAPKRNLEDKTFGFKEKAPLWLSLLELYRALKEEESIEGFMSQLLLREYNEHDLCSALDHKQRGNYKLALKYFEQKLSDSSIFEEEQDLNTKTKILSYLRTEQAYCYALLGKWEPLKEDTPPPLTNKTGLSDFWFYSRFSEGDFKSLIDKNSGFNENTEKEACFGYEMAVVSLFKQEEDIENARHWLGIEKSGFMKRFRSLGGYSEASRHELVDKLQRIYEIKEYMYLLKQETTESFEKALNSLILRWSSRKFSLENATDSILAWYKTFLVRDLCIQKIANGGVRVLNSNQEKRLGELLVENQVKLAHFLIKLGLLDSGDSYLLKVLAKRPKDYFSWDLIKTIAKLKIHQANRTVSKDFLHLAGNFHQIAKVLEKQREKFQVQLDELTDHKFRIYIRKCHEGLLNKIIYNPQAVLDEKNLELMLKTINEIFYKGFSFEEGSFKGGYAIDLKDRELKEGLKGKRLVLKETEALACFCEKVLILLEQNQKLEGVFQKANLKALLFNNLSLLFLHNVIQSLALGLQSDKLLLRTILLVEHYPLILGPEFQSSIAKGSIPLYLFLKWLPQMMHFLQDPSLYQSFEPVFMGLAQKYPQALLYPFHINNQRLFMPEEEIKETKDSFLFELKEVLLKGFPGFEDFVKGLNVLTHPEHRLSYHQTRIMACLKELEEEYTDKDSKNQEFLRKELILLFKDLYYDVLNDDKNTLLGKYNEKFARGYKKPFLDLVGGGNYMQISKLTSKASITDFKGKILKLFKTNSSPETIKKIGSGIEKIESFSRYLFLFTGEEDIEIPGQYSKGFGEPFPQYHVKISGFDQALLTLESLRRPKRVIMYGSDEKVYKFLVKGVEDLRLDQRLQQMFKVMNDGFIKDFGLRNKDLRLKTFEIIPMSKSLGLLEWLENTSPLKELLEKELKSLEGDSSDLKSQNKAFLMRMTWIASFNPKASAQENSKRLLYLDQKTIEDAFQEHEALIPKLLFRNALEKLSVSHEAFFLLKNKVIRNIASVSMACYVLGIGDRHLENFLINWRTGELIAIDFGYSFGAGIRLSLPELLPFRLTQCFEALTLPVGVNGLLRKSLILLLKSLKGRSDFLLQIAEAFIKDPLLDLTLINKEKVSKNNEISSAGTGEEVQTLEDYEGKKLEFMKKKLMGVASWKVMLEELELSRHVKEGYKGMIWEAVMGGRNKGRGVLELEEGLEVNEQVDCLLDQARDKNLLGRTWIGWTPYV